MQSRSIDVGFLPQAEALLARAEKFRTTTLESGAFAWEFTDRRPNVAALREAARLGMTGIEVDRELGGLGFGFREKVRVAEILSRSSIGFAFSLVNTQNVAARLASTGGDRHRDAYLPDLLAGRRFGATALTEPEAGSDFAAITTTARRTDNGWVLHGRKAWITNAVIADVILCYAQTDPDRGRDGIACFVIDGRRDGFEATEGYRLVSGATVGVGGFSLDGYEAAEDDMIVEPGAGFRQALLGVNGARIYVAAMACAAVRAALGQTVDYGSTRESFGQPILAHQGLAWSLAAVANRLEAAEALTARAVDRHEEAQAAVRGESDDNDAVRLDALAAAHAKKFATEMIEPALETCMQAMGAEGLRADHVAGRLLSESRILGYVDGTTEMQTERIGRSLIDFYGSDSPGAVSVAIRTAVSGPEPGLSEVIDLSESDGGDADGEPDHEDEPLETHGFVSKLKWSPDPFSRADQAAGLFADPVLEQGSDREGFDGRESGDPGPIAIGSAAPTDSVVADATRTTEFEPTGDVTVAAGAFAGSASTVAEPLVESVAESPPSTDPPLPTEPPMPPTEPPPPPGMTDVDLPSSPPMPPPPSGESVGFASPPPPPPPTGPPLSADPPGPPPLSANPPRPSEPPMPPGPGSLFEPAERSAAPAVPPVPPVPPPEFQQSGDPTPVAPPLPGDEHRLDSDEADRASTPSMPPLPPDTMRTAD